MPRWIHRTDKTVLRSVAAADLPEAIANYIEEPDLAAVDGQPVKYWVIVGDVVSLADQATRDSIDAAELSAARDAIADEIDQTQSYTKAFALSVIDEINDLSDKINGILDAIDNATNLSSLKSAVGAITDRPTRTAAQLKTAIRNKLDQ